MVEDVQELRLELEAESLLDREALGNRHVVERLVRTVQIRDLSKGPRRSVWSNVGGIRRAACRGSQILWVDPVHIAAASCADVIDADGALQGGCRDSVQVDAAIGIIVESPVAAREPDRLAGLECENIPDVPTAQYLIQDAALVHPAPAFTEGKFGGHGSVNHVPKVIQRGTIAQPQVAQSIDGGVSRLPIVGRGEAECMTPGVVRVEF